MTLLQCILQLALLAFLGMLLASVTDSISKLCCSRQTFIRRRLQAYLPPNSVNHLLWLMENREEQFLPELRDQMERKKGLYSLSEEEYKLSATRRGRLKLFFDVDLFKSMITAIVVMVLAFYLDQRIGLSGKSLYVLRIAAGGLFIVSYCFFVRVSLPAAKA